MNDQDRQNLFAELINRHQSELYGYIYAVVRSWEDADDLFQAVCLVLWDKFDMFRPGTSFFAWARQVAKIKISDFLRHRHSRLPSFVTETLVDSFAADPEDAGAEVYLAALQRCRAKLAIEDENLLQLRYVEELSTVEIANRLQRLQQSVSRSLNRIRRWLFECIELEVVKLEDPSKEVS
jgi:RNA polymerase sigma-70 factor (ECF subfamily)